MESILGHWYLEQNPLGWNWGFLMEASALLCKQAELVQLLKVVNQRHLRHNFLLLKYLRGHIQHLGWVLPIVGAAYVG